jgi:hypothetical protein
MCKFCGIGSEAAAACGDPAAGSLAGRLAAVNRRLDELRRELVALEGERASVRDQLGLRPDDGRDQPKLFESDVQPSLFGEGVGFDVWP